MDLDAADAPAGTPGRKEAASAEVPEARRIDDVHGGAGLEPRPMHVHEPTDSDDELIMDVDCVSSQHMSETLVPHIPTLNPKTLDQSPISASK